MTDDEKAEAVLELLTPGRTWTYISQGDPGEPEYIVTDRITDREILKVYWPWWEGEMRRIGRDDQISIENCIQDFVTGHWAWRADD